MLSPFQQHPGDLGKPGSSQIEAKPKVIILRPAVILVSSCLVDPGFPKSCAGIGDGAFHKYFPGDILMIYQGIQPIIIELKSFADSLSGKSGYQRTNHCNLGIID